MYENLMIPILANSFKSFQLDGLLVSISNRYGVKSVKKKTDQQKEDKTKKESPKGFKKKVGFWKFENVAK